MTGLSHEFCMLADASTASWPKLSLAMMILTAIYYGLQSTHLFQVLVNKLKNCEHLVPGEVISPKALAKLKLARFVWTTVDGKTTLKMLRVDGADRMMVLDEVRGDIELFDFVPEQADFRCVSRCFETDVVINENSRLIRVPGTNGLRLLLDDNNTYEFVRAKRDKVAVVN